MAISLRLHNTAGFYLKYDVQRLAKTDTNGFENSKPFGCLTRIYRQDLLTDFSPHFTSGNIFSPIIAAQMPCSLPL